MLLCMPVGTQLDMHFESQLELQLDMQFDTRIDMHFYMQLEHQIGMHVDLHVHPTQPRGWDGHGGLMDLNRS